MSSYLERIAAAAIAPGGSLHPMAGNLASEHQARPHTARPAPPVQSTAPASQHASPTLFSSPGYPSEPASASAASPSSPSPNAQAASSPNTAHPGETTSAIAPLRTPPVFTSSHTASQRAAAAALPRQTSQFTDPPRPTSSSDAAPSAIELSPLKHLAPPFVHDAPSSSSPLSPSTAPQPGSASDRASQSASPSRTTPSPATPQPGSDRHLRPLTAANPLPYPAPPAGQAPYQPVTGPYQPLVPTASSQTAAAHSPGPALHPRLSHPQSSLPAFRPAIPQRPPDEIQIHIGRIEVTAQPAPAAPIPAPRRTPSLDDYLRRGNRSA